MSPPLRTLTVAATLLFPAATPAQDGAAPAQEDDEREAFTQVLEAWNARRDRFQTLRAEVVADAFQPKGYLNLHKDALMDDPPEGDYPAEDHRFQQEVVQFLDLANGRSRSELRGERHTSTIGWRPFRRILVLNGREWIAYTPPEDRGEDFHKTAYTSGTAPPRGWTNFEALSYPVLWFVGVMDPPPRELSFNPGPRPSPEQFRSEGFVRHDGRRLLVVRQNASRPGQTEPAYWADPERGGAVARYEYVNPGIVKTIDVTHEDRGDLGWVPARWTVTLLESNGSPRLIEEAELTDLEANPALPDDLFDVQPPEGELVSRYGERERETGVYQDPDAPLADPRIAENLDARGSWTPWIIAAAVLVAGSLVLLVRSRQSASRWS